MVPRHLQFDLNFADAAAAVLVLLGYSIPETVVSGDVQSPQGFDFIAANAKGEIVMVDIAVHPAARQSAFLFELVAFLENCGRPINCATALIILPFELRRGQQRTIIASSGFRATILDMGDLRRGGQNDARLIAELEALAVYFGSAEASVHRGTPGSGNGEGTEANRYSLLIDQLNACQAGKAGAKAFEAACRVAIEHVFDRDFRTWKSQYRIEGGSRIADVIGFLDAKSDFWRMVATDFSSRYVVFEFKNYPKPIDKDEYATTTKYLNGVARRTIAIVVARAGEDAPASEARRAYLRNERKLILTLSASELIEMISLRAARSDPTRILQDKLDQLLTSMGDGT